MTMVKGIGMKDTSQGETDSITKKIDRDET